MKLLSVQTLFALAFTTSAGVVVLIAACGTNSAPSGYDNNVVGSSGGGSGGSGSSGGSSSSGAGTSSGGGPTDDGGGAGMDAAPMLITYDGPPPNVDGGMILCATPAGLPIKFNPMYSGYDGTHVYQIPTFVVGMDPASVTWGSSDPTMVDFQPYVQGIMITTKKAGDVTIVARIGSMCGTAPLHITQYTVDQWNLGNTRYHNGVALMINPEAGLFDGSFDASGFDGSYDGGYDASCAMAAQVMNIFAGETPACTNCHGVGSNGMLFGMTIFNDVAHTPEQTGGFSDDQLTQAFVNGTIPDGGTYDPTIAPYCLWHVVHRWTDIDTPDKQAGMRAYLRSLTPQEQTGCFEIFTTKNCADGG